MAFFSASLLLAAVPGPDNVYVLSQSVINGKKSGFMVIFGLCCGLVIHTLSVALGLSAVIVALPLMYKILTILGAVYLLYLAWMSFKSIKPVHLQQSNTLSNLKLYKRGIIMNVTNPKVVIFFLAFFPQFIDENSGNVAYQIILLGLIFITATIVVFGGIALLSSFIASHINSSLLIHKALHIITAIIFITLALHLLIYQGF